MTSPFAEMMGRLRALPPRSIIAIAGAPGSGKSTLADQIAADIPGAHILPMDGFHYDDAILRDRGRLPWKGAPDTFDVAGLIATLTRLKQGGPVAVPVFDRDLELSRANARIIPEDAKLIVVEGNYLLLDRAPWDQLSGAFDLTMMVNVDEPELRRRLTARWQHYRLTADQIAHKLDQNDLPNGRLVRDASRAADITI